MNTNDLKLTLRPLDESRRAEIAKRKRKLDESMTVADVNWHKVEQAARDIERGGIDRINVGNNVVVYRIPGQGTIRIDIKRLNI